jgi:energy-coupling factor transporter ATP-binding protein EcfA2
MTFTFRPAAREQTPLLIGLVGPSGSGKTYSALRLATGIQTVAGGKIAAIDTEARRMLHYADRFKFEYLEFGAPFSSERYLDALAAAVATEAKTIIVDSMSHEHEGAGGYLEYHSAELDRMAGEDWKKRNTMTFAAWIKPAGARRRLINGLLQLNANFVFCFRAKEKMKLVKVGGKTEPVELGWQAIAGEEFVYEMTDRFLLPPGARGVPALDAEAMATGVPKMPEEHAPIIGSGNQLDEDMGAALARWAQGTPAVARPERTERHRNMVADFELLAREQGFDAFKTSWERTPKEDRAAIGTAERDRIGLIGQQHDQQQQEENA